MRGSAPRRCRRAPRHTSDAGLPSWTRMSRMAFRRGDEQVHLPVSASARRRRLQIGSPHGVRGDRRRLRRSRAERQREAGHRHRMGDRARGTTVGLDLRGARAPAAIPWPDRPHCAVPAARGRALHTRGETARRASGCATNTVPWWPTPSQPEDGQEGLEFIAAPVAGGVDNGAVSRPAPELANFRPAQSAFIIETMRAGGAVPKSALQNVVAHEPPGVRTHQQSSACLAPVGLLHTSAAPPKRVHRSIVCRWCATSRYAKCWISARK